jgi:hypothetical protein
MNWAGGMKLDDDYLVDTEHKSQLITMDAGQKNTRVYFDKGLFSFDSALKLAQILNLFLYVL